MTKFLYLFLVFLSLPSFSFSQGSKIVGKWKTEDNRDGKVSTIVHLFKATNGKYYGKIEKLVRYDNVDDNVDANDNVVCTQCKGSNHNKPIVGLVIINHLVETAGKLSGGSILDPKTGKLYYCSINIIDNDKLSVRVSVDKSGFVGRTLTWKRSN